MRCDRQSKVGQRLQILSSWLCNGLPFLVKGGRSDDSQSTQWRLFAQVECKPLQ